MWSIIDSENISLQVVIDLFDGVETDLEEKLELIQKELLVYSYRVEDSWVNDVKNPQVNDGKL